MTNTLERRLLKLEGVPPDPNRPYAIVPEVCKTTEEWLLQLEQQRDGKGHHELLPLQPSSYVRVQRWVPDETASQQGEDP